jgi:hydrogenase maturation factor
MKNLPVGKLSWDYLNKLLGKHVWTDPQVLVGPAVGEDAAVVELGEVCLVAATDPITFATDAIGHYAVAVNANDVATMGAVPRWFLVNLLLPEGRTTLALVEDLFDQLSQACQRLGISLIGGHTEITAGLNRPIVVGTMLGSVRGDRLVTSSGAQPGDVVILTKGIALEGTALIAREKTEDLKTLFGNEFIDRCKNLLYKPGIGVLQDAQAAMRGARVHAMHDPTEGGLATGLWELAQASGLGLRVDREAIRVLPETIRLCTQYDLNPMGLIASGALLIAVSPVDCSQVLEALRRDDIAASVIAHVVVGDEVCWQDGSAVPRFDQDEVAKLCQHGGDVPDGT